MDEHAVDRGDSLVSVMTKKNSRDILAKARVNDEYAPSVPKQGGAEIVLGACPGAGCGGSFAQELGRRDEALSTLVGGG